MSIGDQQNMSTDISNLPLLRYLFSIFFFTNVVNYSKLRCGNNYIWKYIYSTFETCIC